MRWGERLLPAGVLSLLLWPPAAGWDLAQARRRKLLTSWRRFPKSWRPKPRRFFIRQSMGLCHAQPIYAWPDRLSSPRWLSRCSVEGRHHLSQPRERGVVLASLHYGPFELLPYWLRAHGIVTTMVRGSTPESLKGLTSYQYSLSHPGDVPIFLDLAQMTPMPRFKNVRQLLGPGRQLLLTVDVDRGIQFHVPFEGCLFRMATGAIRLAAMAQVDLIPCLIRETSSWKFALHFGAPVSRQYPGSVP